MYRFCLFAAVALGAAAGLGGVETSTAAAYALPTNATAAQLVASCRAMVPADVTLSGRVILRNRRGIVQKEFPYTLVRAAGQTALTVDGKPCEPPAASGEAVPNLFGTDVTWSDLALEYLWWDDYDLDPAREGETVHGQTCAVVRLRKGAREVRAWVDRKTGALMQAEELRDGKAVRRLWGTRLKKFDDRWMANVLEVETLGSGHRTKITVEELK